MDSIDKKFFDDDGILLKSVWKFLSPTNQTMILFKSEHELAMGGPLMGTVGILFENQVLIRLDGIFSEEVKWQTNGQYAALAEWFDTKGRHSHHKICVIDVPNLQIGEFEELIFVKQFTQFKDNIIECEYYENQNVRVFSGQLKSLTFRSLRTKTAA